MQEELNGLHVAQCFRPGKRDELRVPGGLGSPGWLAGDEMFYFLQDVTRQGPHDEVTLSFVCGDGRESVFEDRLRGDEPEFWSVGPEPRERSNACRGIGYGIGRLGGRGTSGGGPGGVGHGCLGCVNDTSVVTNVGSRRLDPNVREIKNKSQELLAKDN